MEKEILEIIKKTIMSQEEKKKELASNTEEFYKILWSYLIDEVNKDIYGLEDTYKKLICYKEESGIMSNVHIYDKEENVLNEFSFDKNILAHVLEKLMEEDGIVFDDTFVGNLNNNLFRATIEISREKILELLKESDKIKTK